MGETANDAAPAGRDPALTTDVAERRRTRHRLISPLTRRILAVNLIAPAVLIAGFLYLGEYRRGLIVAELKSLDTQAQMFAAALGEGAVEPDSVVGERLVSGIANQMVRRLVETTGTRARLFQSDGRMIADSRILTGGGTVQIETLPPPEDPQGSVNQMLGVYDRIVNGFSLDTDIPYLRQDDAARNGRFVEVQTALRGEPEKAVRAMRGEALMLHVAVPVQRYKMVLGALMLSKDSHAVDQAVLEVRRDILKVAAVALVVTVLLSIYLAGTLARPIRRLAMTAEQVRQDHGRKVVFATLPDRDDEIGDLALALKDMTEAMWERLDAIERFAADVAHEIKNPLTSLRSAVETVGRVTDPAQREKLLTIIQEDVGRLDRLITDISDASRIDAELSRAEATPLDLGGMLATLVDVHGTTRENAPTLRLDLIDTGDLVVIGIEDRLVQVFRNLIANAVTFSPPRGEIRLTLRRDNGAIEITIDDDGPGIPDGKEHLIFDRFYTERASGEKFGTHSGLGLSISRQIVEAHDGTITATNRHDGAGRTVGARFTVRLPSGS